MRATRRLEHAGQPDLFGEAPVAAIEGLRYESEFLSRDERHEIEEQAEGIKLVTYDDLLAYGASRQILNSVGTR